MTTVPRELLPFLLALVACSGASAPRSFRPLTAQELDDLAAREALVPALADQAKAHRAWAANLRNEARVSCIGVPELERDAEPFAGRYSIQSATEIVQANGRGKADLPRVRGVRIVLRAMPGLTRPWLALLLRCHAASHSLRPSEEGFGDALAVPGAAVTVTETETGFAVVVSSEDDDAAREIVRRARGLFDKVSR